MAEASTDSTRKIATLRNWSEHPHLIDPKYLSEIANEFERVYTIMLERARTIEALEATLGRARRDDY